MTKYQATYFKRNIRVFGITPEQFQALFDKQNGKCAICSEAEAIVTLKGMKRRLSIDHNHVTGKIRGLLCMKCNRGLGYFIDDKKLLQTAIDYLVATDE